MSGKAIMVQGTASHVGKSVLVTALCRIFRQDGLRVAPFKAQNMSNNSYVTPDGGEIGRAQAVQAEAAGVEPTVDMNPVLLKPEADNRSQIVLLGRPLRTASARDYYAMKAQLWQTLARSLDTLLSRYDLVVMEGAGSPVEVNLKQDEIVNMRVARYANAPVLLVADIDRGGVFASLVGTLDLLEPEERALVKGLVVNKFRGDPSLFAPGLTFLKERTGVPVVGVIPYFQDIRVPQEDSVALDKQSHQDRTLKGAAPHPAPVLDVAVIRLPRISNFDDFDPLEREPGVAVRYANAPEDVGKPDLLILPGTKSTVADLEWLRRSGLAQIVGALRSNGTPAIGICGGYQMLGRSILDPHGVESPSSQNQGLGLLEVTTVFEAAKETHRVHGHVLAGHGLLAHAQGAQVQGYEIHMGRTFGEGMHPALMLTHRSGAPWQQPDGALSADGLVMGTYLHGLFHNTSLRRAVLQTLAERKGVMLPPAGAEAARDAEYDKLADLVRSHLDMGLVYRALGLEVARNG